MVRRHLFIVITLLSISSVTALTCAADNLDKPGTCLSSTFSFFGKNVYESCYFDPYYSSENLWLGYKVCYATIRTGSLTSDAGTPVAEYSTTNTNQLTICSSYNGAGCDVFTSDGYTIDSSANDRGSCDASDQNCVKCNTNKIEIKRWTGGGWILGSGDYKCESGCSAPTECDEADDDAWSDNQISGTAFEAYCSTTCTISQSRCRFDFGADIECDYKAEGTDCITDACDASNRLVDYNDNQVYDSVPCTGSCICDTTYNTPLCDTECGASTECNNQLIGYNNSHQGCDNTCAWNTCDPYAWNEGSDSCRTDCTNNGHCYTGVDPYVCDLIGEYINTCLVDNTPPIVSITYPTGTPKINDTLNLQYTVTDNADLLLDCEYIVDSDAPVSLGEVAQGANSQGVTNTEGWHNIQVNCTDGSTNEGASNVETFLFDETAPNYTDHGWTNQTVIEYGYIMFNDVIVLHAYWSDTHNLSASVLWNNKTGTWLEDGLVDHDGNSTGWSNYTMDLSDYGNTTIAWQILTNDSAGNYNETIEDSFFVYNYTTDITVELNELPINGELEFQANGQPTAGGAPIDTLRTALLGDFNVTHVGVGLPINISFKLNETLDSDFTVKLNDVSEYSNATALTTTPQQGCFGVMPSNTCQVWVWLDWTGDEVPGSINNKIEIESFIS